MTLLRFPLVRSINYGIRIAAATAQIARPAAATYRSAINICRFVAEKILALALIYSAPHIAKQIIIQAEMAETGIYLSIRSHAKVRACHATKTCDRLRNHQSSDDFGQWLIVERNFSLAQLGEYGLTDYFEVIAPTRQFRISKLHLPSLIGA